MRILIYGLNYAPEPTGIGKYTGEMAEWLAEHKHQVRVVTGYPYYPAWQLDPSDRGKGYSQEIRAYVDVRRCPLWVKQNPSGLERLFHLASFALSSATVMLGQITWKPDVVMVVEPAFFCLPIALLTARLAGSHSWLHIQDLEIDAAFELGLVPNHPWIQTVVKRIERWICRRFDRVSSISPQMLERLVCKGLTQEAISLLPNWVDTDHIIPLNRPNRLRQQLGFKPEDVVVLYSGSMGRKQGLELLLEAAERVKTHPRLRFVLCGDGVTRQELELQAQEMQLTNVTFLPLQPVEKLNELLNLADIHALIQKDASADLVMPSKLTGMLASGRPVLATARPDTAVAAVLESARCGQLLPPEQVDPFVSALLQMAADPITRQQLGRQGRIYAEENLSRDAILHKFNQELDSLEIVSEFVSASATTREPAPVD